MLLVVVMQQKVNTAAARVNCWHWYSPLPNFIIILRGRCLPLLLITVLCSIWKDIVQGAPSSHAGPCCWPTTTSKSDIVLVAPMATLMDSPVPINCPPKIPLHPTSRAPLHPSSRSLRLPWILSQPPSTPTRRLALMMCLMPVLC